MILTMIPITVFASSYNANIYIVNNKTNKITHYGSCQNYLSLESFNFIPVLISWLLSVIFKSPSIKFIFKFVVIFFENFSFKTEILDEASLIQLCNSFLNMNYAHREDSDIEDRVVMLKWLYNKR